MTSESGNLDEFLSRHGDIGEEPSLAVGTEVGEWRVTGFLGRGGSSEVYCVKNTERGISAALKVLHRTKQRHKERFTREARFLKENTSPSFPRFFASGVFGERPYMVVELLEPMELPQSDRDVARYLCSVAHGLEWLHIHGFVHRDIKPRNIMSRNGEPVIIDFGLLKEVASAPIGPDDQLSIVDGKAVGVGTPRYAAPEQFSGGDASPATDIHALGRLAYECFDGNPPRAWSRIIRRATSSIPGERFQSAADFISAVRRRHLWRNLLLCLIACVCTAAGCVLFSLSGGYEKLKYSMLTENTTTNVVTTSLVSLTVETNKVDSVGNTYSIPRVKSRVFAATTNVAAVTIKRLGGAMLKLDKPVVLDPNREYWIIGPGSIDVAFVNSKGATVRLNNCMVTNRTSGSLKESGIRYVMYRGVTMTLTEMSQDMDEEREFIGRTRLELPDDDTAENRGINYPLDYLDTKLRYGKAVPDPWKAATEAKIREMRRRSERRNY